MADDYSDAFGQVLGNPAPAVGAVQENPDQAAEAIRVGQATGTPASVVYPDVDGFKAQVKAQATSALVRQNPQLGQFTIDPMAARVSNDDLATLDTVSQHMTKAAEPSAWDRLGQFAKAQASNLTDFHAFAQGYDAQGQHDDFMKLYNYIDSDAWRTLVAVTAPLTMSLNTGVRVYSGVTNQIMSDIATDINQTQILRDPKHYDPKDVEDMTAQVGDLLQKTLPPDLGLHEAPHAAPSLADIAGPYIKEGKVPPVGVDPTIDAIHLAQSQKDLASLKDALVAAQDSTTRERAPSYFSKFINQHTEDSLGISPQAVRELYGDKLPQPNDGLLGFVSDLPSQLLRATVTGEDIQVPVRDYATYIDPSIHNQLEPSIRTRPGGITQAEAAEIQPQRYQTVDMYHATNQEFDQFDPNAPTTKGGRSPIEDGVSFFGDSPEEVARYGNRVIKAQIDRGKTATFNATDLYNNDPSFLDKIVEASREENADRDPDLAEQAAREQKARYDLNQQQRVEAINAELARMSPEERAGFDPAVLTAPPKVGNVSGARQAIIKMAKEQGLDSVRIEGLREGNQLAVLNPAAIRQLTDQERVIGVLRQQAGIDKALPQRSYQVLNEPVADANAVVNNPLREGAGQGGGDVMFLRRNDTGQGLVDEYHDVGKPEDLGYIIQDLHDIVGTGVSPLESANATAMGAVLDHLGISNLRAYSVWPDNPIAEGINGLYHPNSDAVVLKHTEDYPQMLHTAVHEAGHAAFFHALESNAELKGGIEALLDEAARNTNFDRADLGKGLFETPYGFSEHYGLTNAHEFVSEALSNPKFQEHLANIPASPELLTKLGLEAPRSKLASLWDAMLMMARKAFGMPLTDESLSVLDATFKVTDRLTKAAEDIRREAGAAQPALAQLDPISARAAAIGMNRRQTLRYRELIGERAKAEFDAQNQKIVDAERKRQTEEWKVNKVDVRKEVSDSLAQRPDVRADAILRGKEQLDTDALTPEQRASLPEGFYGRDGIHPDALADEVGYESGDKLIKGVADFAQDRGEQRPIEHFRKLVSDATDKEMEARYGNLDQNVIEAAKSQVLSGTQIDLLHTEAEAAGLPISKDTLRANVKQAVSEMPMEKISSDAAMSAAGRAAQRIEDALLKEDPAEAFKARMDQYNHLLAAKEMLRIEKEKAAFDRLAKTYSKQQVSGASQDFVNQMHAVMGEFGLQVRRSPEELRAAMEGTGQPDLREFMSQPGRKELEIKVPDWFDQAHPNDIGKLSAAQFSDLKDFFTSMAHNARMEERVVKAGEAMDFSDLRSQMIERIRSTFDKVIPPRAEGNLRAGDVLDAAKWVSINMESMMDRLDNFDREGEFTQSVTRLFTSADNADARMLKEYNLRLANEIGDLGDLDRKVDNSLFIDPATKGAGDVPLAMNRRMVLGAVQNAGNLSNLTKLVEGYGINKEALWDFLKRNTTVEDWDKAQKIGDIFKDLFDHANDMSHRLSGVGLKNIDLEPFEDPHGVTRDGWYNPAAYNGELGKDVTKKHVDMESLPRYRATTNQNYTKTRTGYVAPMELNFNVVPVRMRQMIRDINAREPLIQMNKIFHDRAIANEITRRYGKGGYDEMMGFLDRFAGKTDAPVSNLGTINRFLSGLSSRFISATTGLNPNTVTKHGLSAMAASFAAQPVGWTAEFGRMLSEVPFGSASWKMAMDKSDVLGHRSSTFQEMMQMTGQDISLYRSGSATKVGTLRDWSQYIGSKPIAFFDHLSAVPTWLASYRSAIANGFDEGSALFKADTAVREVHGSTLPSNRPSIAASHNAMVKSFGALYNYFSEKLQQAYKANCLLYDAMGLMRQGDLAAGARNASKAAGILFVANVIPALIDYSVYRNKEDAEASWSHFLMKIGSLSAFAPVLLLRDIASSLSSGHDESYGSVPGALKTIVDVGRDIVPDKHGHVAVTNPAKFGKALRETTIAVATATGIGNAQLGKLAQFTYDYYHGNVHPHNSWQTYIGIRNGTLKGHTRSFDDWVHQDLTPWRK